MTSHSEQIYKFICDLQEQISKPFDILQANTNTIMQLGSTLQTIYSTFIQSSKANMDQQQNLLAQVISSINNVEKQYHYVDMMEDVTTFFEEAISEMERICFGKSQGLFKKKYTDIEIQQKKTNIDLQLQNVKSYFSQKNILPTSNHQVEEAVQQEIEQLQTDDAKCQQVKQVDEQNEIVVEDQQIKQTQDSESQVIIEFKIKKFVTNVICNQIHEPQITLPVVHTIDVNITCPDIEQSKTESNIDKEVTESDQQQPNMQTETKPNVVKKIPPRKQNKNNQKTSIKGIILDNDD